MRPLAIRRTPKPTELAAIQRRKAIAAERVKSALAGLLDGLDHETRIETCRAGIRTLAIFVAEDRGAGEACGQLSGALARVSPAYRSEGRFVEAEAVFRKVEGANDE
jgi:hypothetical protein